MKIIGITGKSTFAELLAIELNGKYIDKIGHEVTLYSSKIEELCNKFGKGILGEKEKVDRKN